MMDSNNGCKTSTFVNVVNDGTAAGVYQPSEPFNLCTSSLVTIFPLISSTSPSTYSYSWYSPVGAFVSGVYTPSLTTNTQGTYTVTVVEVPGCTKDIFVDVVFCVGIKEGILNSSSIQVSPNPNNGNVTITLKKEGAAELSLFDLRGVKILDLLLKDKTDKIDLSAQPNGIYLLEVKQGGVVTRTKIIKE